MQVDDKLLWKSNYNAKVSATIREKNMRTIKVVVNRRQGGIFSSKLSKKALDTLKDNTEN